MTAINKKRKRSSRMRGSHTHGRGFKKKARGSGHRGGFGMAGTGKRADQKKTLLLNMDEDYFGKKGLNVKKKRYTIINVGELDKLSNGKKELDLKKFKILGNGEVKTALTIHAYSASESAVEKIKKAGGKIIIISKDETGKSA
ncbi:MAG: uL15 family ribosomal protein [Candidatus Pacearchaeota archaeon]|jgi:large subunit ribosomal protein L15